jgi:hypothetical protein
MGEKVSNSSTTISPLLVSMHTTGQRLCAAAAKPAVLQFSVGGLGCGLGVGMGVLPPPSTMVTEPPPPQALKRMARLRAARDRSFMGVVK